MAYEPDIDRRTDPASRIGRMVGAVVAGLIVAGLLLSYARIWT